VAQGSELVAVFPIAGKQNQAAYQRVFEAFFVRFAQRSACNVNDQGGVLGHDLLSIK
jgi:hypothetical protein